MEKTAVLALGHLARAPRGTARIYFTGCARRGLARCPQPLATVLVADLAALHSLACTSNTGRDCDFLTDPPFFFPPRLTGAFPILGRPCPPTDPRFFFPPLTGVPRSPCLPHTQSFPASPRTNPTSARVLRAKTTPGLAGTTARLLSVKRSHTQGRSRAVVQMDWIWDYKKKIFWSLSSQSAQLAGEK